MGSNREFNVAKAGAEGLKNYANALWGEGYIPDPNFPKTAMKLFENHSHRLAALEDALAAERQRMDGLQMQLGEARGDTVKPKHDGPTLQQILSAAAQKWRVPQKAIMSYTREARTNEARKEAFYKSRRAGFSYPEIGKFYGRCHTTVHSSVAKYALEHELALDK